MTHSASAKSYLTVRRYLSYDKLLTLYNVFLFMANTIYCVLAGQQRKKDTVNIRTAPASDFIPHAPNT